MLSRFLRLAATIGMALALIASALGSPGAHGTGSFGHLLVLLDCARRRAVQRRAGVGGRAVDRRCLGGGRGDRALGWFIVAKRAEAFGRELNAVSMVDAQNGWTVGQRGTLLRWDGSTWTRFAAPTIKDLLAVDMISANDGWAVGVERSSAALERQRVDPDADDLRRYFAFSLHAVRYERLGRG